jgi:hypothetical protein
VEEVFSIKVLNWDRWNPKRAQKTYTWLRLDNDAVTSQDLHKVSAEGRLLWIYLLCQASKKNGDTFRLDAEFVGHATGVSRKGMVAALSIFKKRGMISAESDKNGHDALSLHQTTPALHGTTPALHGTTPTDGRTDETNGTDGRDETDAPDIEVIHKTIPELAGGIDVDDFLSRIPEKSQRRWVSLYGADHVKREVLKAIGWLEDSGETKKNYAKFMSGWLSRGDKDKPKGSGSYKTKDDQRSENNLSLLAELRGAK